MTSNEIARPENRWNGDNRYGWSSQEYDRAFAAWTSTLGRTERVPHVATMEKVITEQLPIIANYFEATVTAAVSNLDGPLPRQTESGAEFSRLYLWQWKS
jgi:ABC-type oligopeptide transport system substrate-binding subunit